VKRWILRILLCLLLGAITTVAVAWRCAWRSDAHSLQAFYPNAQVELEHRRLEPLQERDEAWLRARGMDNAFASDWSENPIRMFWIHRARWVGLEQRVFTSQSGGPHSQFEAAAQMRAGWPSLALYGERLVDRYLEREHQILDRISSAGAFELDWSQPSLLTIWRPVKHDPLSTKALAFLPLRPIWPGFVIDTLFYAAIWFGVFFGFASAKRAIRRKRGRCPMCGYDLRNALDKGCSECGWQRQASG
jgi:hypothetical protein